MIAMHRHAFYFTPTPRFAYKWLRTDRTPPFKRPNKYTPAAELRYSIYKWMPKLDPLKLALCEYGYHAIDNPKYLYEYYYAGDNRQAHLDLWSVVYRGGYIVGCDKIAASEMQLVKIEATHQQVCEFVKKHTNSLSIQKSLLYNYEDFCREVINTHHFNR